MESVIKVVYNVVNPLFLSVYIGMFIYGFIIKNREVPKIMRKSFLFL